MTPFLCFFALLVGAAAAADEMQVIFRNELREDVLVFWEGADRRIPQGDPIPALGGELKVTTFPEHKFTYDFGGQRHWVEIRAGRNLEVFLASQTEILVRCTTTASGFRGELFYPSTLVSLIHICVCSYIILHFYPQLETGQPLNIRVIPWWSPRGACRFLELVRDHYYDGCALNRVVPNFLTQFGIAADTEKRRHWRDRPIADDPKRKEVRFLPGMLSHAGSGPDSRYAEVFVVMPNTPEHQLEHFGSNSWETPFGIVQQPLDETPISRWHVTGDIQPFGDGTDPQRIHQDDGYEYLMKNFPELDYIEICRVEEISVSSDKEL